MYFIIIKIAIVFNPHEKEMLMEATPVVFPDEKFMKVKLFAKEKFN